jgi:hypothetical protein
VEVRQIPRVDLQAMAPDARPRRREAPAGSGGE